MIRILKNTTKEFFLNLKKKIIMCEKLVAHNKEVAPN